MCTASSHPQTQPAVELCAKPEQVDAEALTQQARRDKCVDRARLEFSLQMTRADRARVFFGDCIDGETSGAWLPRERGKSSRGGWCPFYSFVLRLVRLVCAYITWRAKRRGARAPRPHVRGLRGEGARASRRNLDGRAHRNPRLLLAIGRAVGVYENTVAGKKRRQNSCERIFFQTGRKIAIDPQNGPCVISRLNVRRDRYPAGAVLGDERQHGRAIVLAARGLALDQHAARAAHEVQRVGQPAEVRLLVREGDYRAFDGQKESASGTVIPRR